MKEKLWGGAYTKDPNGAAWEFGQSIVSDLELWREEIEVSQAHAEMLGACGIISPQESEEILQGLGRVSTRLMDPPSMAMEAEDIHALVESMLRAEIGEAADKIHTGRSRNDQIATVTRLWTRRRADDLIESIRCVQDVLINLGEEHATNPMPGFTHMQSAQPITLGFHLLAYFWMLERDVERLLQLKMATRECPLGAAALAGTSLPIDRHLTSDRLGFDAPMPNALDATSDRDFVGDALHAGAMLMQHLSRLSQELVLWSSPMYDFMRLDDGLTTGSSIMPQKRNPDIAELIRGRSARVVGTWVAFMTMMKALPLGYNRDQQDDKPPLFDSFRLCYQSLYLCQMMLETAVFRTERMEAVAGAGFSTATQVAEAMVQQGVPFRKAHEETGKLVRKCEHEGRFLDMTVEESIARRETYGGPGPSAVKRQIEEARAALEPSAGKTPAHRHNRKQP